MNTGSRADTAREILFGDSLACEEIRPIAFTPGPLEPIALHIQGQHAEGLLRALAVVEDGRIDEPDERTSSELSLHRIETKLDLLITLISTRVQGSHHDAPLPLNWSARGACMPTTTPYAVGTTGIFRIQPVDWLPEPLQLPATVLACIGEDDSDAPAQLWLRFGPLSAQLDLALERHVFRVHRREVAERRRPRAA